MTPPTAEELRVVAAEDRAFADWIKRARLVGEDAIETMRKNYLRAQALERWAEELEGGK